MTKVALISSHAGFQQHFLEALPNTVPTKTVTTALQLEDFFQCISKRSKFDLIFVDVTSTQDSSLLIALSKRFACTELIALVAEETPEHTYQCLRAGASGYLHRDSLDLLPLFFKQGKTKKSFPLKDKLLSYYARIIKPSSLASKSTPLVPGSY